MPCDRNGVAHKLTDGVWVEVPCDPTSQRVCWYHKINHLQTTGPNINIPDRFKQDMTQRELAKDIFDHARASGTELQHVG